MASSTVASTTVPDGQGGLRGCTCQARPISRSPQCGLLASPISGLRRSLTSYFHPPIPDGVYDFLRKSLVTLGCVPGFSLLRSHHPASRPLALELAFHHERNGRPSCVSQRPRRGTFCPLNTATDKAAASSPHLRLQRAERSGGSRLLSQHETLRFWGRKKWETPACASPPERVASS